MKEIIAVPLPFPITPDILVVYAKPAASPIWLRERFGHDRRSDSPRTAPHNLVQRDQTELQQEKRSHPRKNPAEQQQGYDGIALFP